MLRSHLERGPAKCKINNLSKFRELTWIWENSLWQSHSNRAPSVHLQDRNRPKSYRVVVDSGRLSTQCSTNLSDVGLALSGEHHKLAGHLWGSGWMYVPGQQKVWEHGNGALRKWQTKLRKWCKLGKKENKKKKKGGNNGNEEKRGREKEEAEEKRKMKGLNIHKNYKVTMKIRNCKAKNFVRKM